MAWTVTRKWVNPPQYDEAGQNRGVHRAHVILSGVSDGTAEASSQQALDISVLQTVNGTEAARMAIESIQWNIVNTNHISLAFDRAPEDSIGIFTDVGFSQFSPPFADRGEVGDGDGDLVFDSSGAAATSRFRIEVVFRVS